MQVKTYKKAIDACEAYRKDPDGTTLTTEQFAVFKRLEFAYKAFKEESNTDTYLNAGAVHDLLRDVFSISRSQACLDLSFALEVFATDFSPKAAKSIAIDTLLSIIRNATREKDEKMRLKAVTELRFATGFHLIDENQPSIEQRMGAVVEITDDGTKQLVKGIAAAKEGTLDLNTLTLNDLKLTDLFDMKVKELREGTDFEVMKENK